MSTFILPLKISSPKYKKPQSIRSIDFRSLDVNGRSYSPQNLQQNPYSNEIEMNYFSLGVDYESKKFKVRTQSNFVKTAQNWRNLPYQRIRKVQNSIERSKIRQNFAMSERGGTIIPQFEHACPQTSPKTMQKRYRKQQKDKIQKRLQSRRLKQIQQVIKTSKQEQSRNIIKFEKKNIQKQSKELFEFFTNNKGNIQSPYCKGERQQELRAERKGTIYAYMVKNRRKLSERRHSKKKSVDYSLMSKLTNLQSQHQSTFQLQNSVDRVRFSGS